MKILAISHSCVTDVNQQLYVALSQIPNVEINLVIPVNWKSEYTGKTIVPSCLPGVDFSVHSLPAGVPGHNSLHFYWRRLYDVIRKFDPDIVFLDEEPWSLIALQTTVICSRLKKKLVCYTKQNIYKSYPIPFKWIEQKVYHSAAAIIALSEEVKSVLRQKGFAGSCPLLAHACDIQLFYQGDAKELREKLGLQGLVIGFMGRFVPEKGLTTLIQALLLITEKRLDTKISALFVGSGPEESTLKQITSASDKNINFVFAGSVPHLEAGHHLRCMDIFVIPSRTTPSWKEQFGRVIIEAMACGIPVVGSDSGQIPVLIQSTSGGLTFEEGNAEDLAEKLLCLINDPAKRARLGKIGQAAVRSSYTYEAVAQQLHGILVDAASV